MLRRWLLLPVLCSGALAQAPDSAFFESKIRPVLIANCYKCHSVESGKSEGGLLLDSRAGWERGDIPAL